MEDRFNQVLAAYQRSRTFLVEHPAPDPETYAQAATALDDAIAAIIEHVAAQVFGREQSVAERKRRDQLLKRLRVRHLRPVVTIAKSHMKASPAIAAAFNMPSQQLRVAEQLAVAESIAQAAVPYKENFVRFGRRPEFIEELKAAIEDVRTAADAADRHFGYSAGARAGIEEEIRKGRAVLQVLDAIVKSTFEGNDVVLRKWELAKRIKLMPTQSEPTATAPAA